MRKQGVKVDDAGVAHLFKLMDINHSGSVEFDDFKRFMDNHWNRRSLSQAKASAPPQRRLRCDRLWRYYEEQLPLYLSMPRATEDQRRLRTAKGRELRAIAAAAESAALRYVLAPAAANSSLDQDIANVLAAARGRQSATRPAADDQRDDSSCGSAPHATNTGENAANVTGKTHRQDDPAAQSERLWRYYREQLPVHGLMPTSTEDERQRRAKKARELKAIAAAAEVASTEASALRFIHNAAAASTSTLKRVGSSKHSFPKLARAPDQSHVSPRNGQSKSVFESLCASPSATTSRTRGQTRHTVVASPSRGSVARVLMSSGRKGRISRTTSSSSTSSSLDGESFSYDDTDTTDTEDTPPDEKLDRFDLSNTPLSMFGGTGHGGGAAADLMRYCPSPSSVVSSACEGCGANVSSLAGRPSVCECGHVVESKIPVVDASRRSEELRAMIQERIELAMRTLDSTLATAAGRRVLSREARRKFHNSEARARQAMLTGVKIAVTQQCHYSFKRPSAPLPMSRYRPTKLDGD